MQETLLGAADLGTLGIGRQVGAGAVIGAGPAQAADVFWYEFHVPDQVTEHVRVSALTREIGSPLVATVSLFNDAPFDQFNPIDYYTPTGHRMLAQDDAGSHGGDAVIDRLLGPGDYWVAVSGSGNDNFSQTLADSGLAGSTGAFQLSVAASDPGPGYSDPNTPVVLASDPALGAVLDRSPFLLRFDLNTPIDPGTVTPQLFFNTTNDFSFGPSCTAAPVSLGNVSFEPVANELLVQPAAPLTAGYYEVVLPNYGPGGASDYVVPFQINGLAGNLDPTLQPGVTPGSAYQVPNATDGRLHQLTGAVGDDPTDAAGFDSNGVEYYHFTVGGTDPYALDAEVFAGRIGSPLEPVLTLFQADGNGLHPLMSNAGTQDRARDAVSRTPLATDPALFATLAPGDYYLAVSTGQNYPGPGITDPSQYFDPATPHSGSGGNSTGPYVFNLLLQRPGPAPHVVSVTPDTGPDGHGPLTALHVRFDEPVNLLPVAFNAFLESHNGGLSSVTLTAPDQSTAPLRLESYDSATNTATFILLSPTPAGEYSLQLSGDGPEAITSATGTPLAGNVTLTGEHRFETTFQVSGAPPRWAASFQPGSHDPQHPQNVGVLFPVRLSRKVTFSRPATSRSSDTEDDYSFTVLQSRLYTMTISGSALPAQFTVTFLDPMGQVIDSYTYDRRHPPLPFQMAAGTYTLRISWSGAPGPYTVKLGLINSPENPTPLVVGSGPALRVRLLTSTGDGAAPAAPAVTGGGAPSGVVGAASSSGALPGAFTLPGSALLAQGFSPLQGVGSAGGTDSPTGGEQLAVRAPAAQGGADPQLTLVAVTQAPLDAPSEGNVALAPAALVPRAMSGRSVLGHVGTASRLLDVLYEYWDWFNASVLSPAEPIPGPSAPSAEAEAGQGGLGSVLPRHAPVAGAAEAVSDTSWAWACAVAAGALAVPSRSRRRGGARMVRVGVSPSR
jgi:hypothetical protein